MSERPTPITDRMQIAYRKAWSERNEKGAVDDLLISHADLERQLSEAREEISRIRKFATVNGVAELERQLSESKAQLAIADEQLALERGALAEAREQRDALAEALKKACAHPVCGNWYEDAQSTLAAVKETPNAGGHPPGATE